MLRRGLCAALALLTLLSLTAARAERVSASEGVRVTATESNRWQSEGKTFCQYDLTAENTLSSAVADWRCLLAVGPCEVEQCWNCVTEYAEGGICVTPLDYAKRIEPGQTVSGVGMIVSFGAEAAPAAAESSAAPIGRAPESAKSAFEAAKGGGRLRVADGRLVNAAGEPVQLRGVSTHGIAWYPRYVCEESLRALRDELGVNAVRLCMYTGEEAGYCAGGDQAGLKDLLEKGVGILDGLGLYAIVDWHTLSDNDPNAHIDEALAFWADMSARLADRENVIYEICNEPNGGVTWARVKEYAERVIPVIRKNDPEAVILTGTPNWCQQLEGPAADPLSDGNVMYTLHFYAATHKQELRTELRRALAAGLPVFISECSICDASGSGAIDYDSAAAWLDLIDEYALSYMEWNLSNKDESSAILKPECGKLSGWTEDDLSETAKWFAATFRR